MAKIQLMAVYDRVGGFYQNPFFVPSVGIATRSFVDEVNREADNNALFKHSADFDLYHLAVFDDHTGLLQPLDLPNLIIQGTSAKQKE